MAKLEIDTRKVLTDSINDVIKNGVNTNDISDGYHTFGELYEHRIALFKALCKVIQQTEYDKEVCFHNRTEYMQVPWKSKLHSDGSGIDGWFIGGLYQHSGLQITYHIPISEWDTWPAAELNKAPEFDGHTSDDVLQRLKSL